MANSFLDEEDPTTAWAQAAVAGRIVVGEYVCGQAERHLRDIRDGARRGIHWRPEAAAHALGFLPAVFSVTDGPKAGQPFHPLAWQTFVIGSLFGWLTSTGRWRFRSAWLETGKGQAKSPLMGAMGVYVMGWCDIPRAQVFAIGNDRATANVLFRDAVAMCRADIPDQEETGDSLEAREEVIIRGEGDNAWKIEHPSTGSFFRTLAGGERQSGPRPALVLADEIHEFRTDTSLKIWEEAIAKVAGNAMMVLGTNTPAASQHVGTSYADFYMDVASGRVKDDTAFAFVARVDRSDKETVFENEACWVKALPALGETFPIENIRASGDDRAHAHLDGQLGQASLFRHSDRCRRFLDHRRGVGEGPRSGRREGAARQSLLSRARPQPEERSDRALGRLDNNRSGQAVPSRGEDLVLDDARRA